MGLDLRVCSPVKSVTEFIHGNENGRVMRVVKDMNHYCLVATSGKTMREVKFDILQHIAVMMAQLDTYEYEPTDSRNDLRDVESITLLSDLEIMAQLVGELNQIGVPDNWTVEWDY